ncbi:hypothetical protein TELCIR_17275, partial [Teladorsagia circumcincta]
IFEVLNVKSTIATTSCVHSEAVSKAIGIPSAASYVPGAMSTKGDVMGMFERLQNVVEITLGAKFFDTLFEMEIAAFRAKFGQDFKDYQELLAQVSYVFTNSNPYLDYPRPNLHKSIDIGGIAVSLDSHRNALPKELDEILNIRKTNVIVSFGTVVKSCYMPDEYKKSLLEVFQMMPATTFIWKYEIEDSEMIRNLTNVPLFADQIRNANMLAKHGGAIVLQKYDLISPRRMASALESIIYNKSFGRIPNLDPYGRHLTTMQYYNIDLFLLVIVSVICTIYVSYRIFKLATNMTAAFVNQCEGQFD